MECPLENSVIFVERATSARKTRDVCNRGPEMTLGSTSVFGKIYCPQEP